MRKSAKLGLSALIAALLLSAAISTALARELAVSTQNIRVVWSRLEIAGPITGSCRVTLEGSFHRANIPKVRATLAGAITRATVDTNNCTNSRMTAEGLPWHITYEEFRGTLPRIEEVFLLLRNRLVRIEISGTSAQCRYGLPSDTLTLRVILNASNEVTNLVPVSGRNILSLLERRNDGFGLCPASLALGAAPADGVLTLLGTTNRIRITLI